jgi:GNAT superfamily N-acetyltransferase
MLRFLWNKKMQEANIFGAGGLYFIKVKNPQGDDTEFAQKILNNESGDVRFQLRDNMELVAMTVSGTGVAIEGIQEAQSQVQTFFTSSNLIAHEGTLIGGSSQPEFDLFMAYLESTHRWLEAAVRKMLQPYLDGNGFTDNWDIRVTIPDLEYDKSQTLLSAVSSAYTTKSITLAERRKIYEKVGIETKDLKPEDEKKLLAEYEAANPPPATSPFVQKVEALAKVVSATPLDPHAFVSKAEMGAAIAGIDGRGDKKSLPFPHSPPMRKGGEQSSQHLHGGPGSGRYPAGSGNITVSRYPSSDGKNRGGNYKIYDDSKSKVIGEASFTIEYAGDKRTGTKDAAETIGAIHSIDVDEGYRRNGIASAILRKCEEDASKEGVTRIEALHVIQDSEDFWKSNGYSPEGNGWRWSKDLSTSKTHGGPGSGRYPKGSGGNESSSMVISDDVRKAMGGYLEGLALAEESEKSFPPIVKAYGDALIGDDGDPVQMYVFDGYSDINSFLRDGSEWVGHDSTLMEDQVASIEFAIDEAPELPEGTVLYRGVGFVTGQQLANKEVGAICEDKAFQSHTLDPNVAQRFAKTWQPLPVPEGSLKYHQTVIRAITDGKQKAVYVKNAGQLKESEALLQRGSRWKIVGKDVFPLHNEAQKGYPWETTTMHVITVVPAGGKP